MGFNPLEPRGPDGRWIGSAISLLKSTGGFTFNARGEKIDNGYAVAVPTPHGGRDWKTVEGDAGVDDINRFLAEFDADLRPSNRTIGGWKDPETGNTVLDVGEVHTNIREAASQALKGRQHSVYNLGSGEEITTRDLLTRAISKQPPGLAIQYGDYTVVRTDKKDRNGNVTGSVWKSYFTDAKKDKGRTYKNAAKLAAHFADLAEGHDMARDTLTPAYDGDFDLSRHDGKLAFWKQILPMKRVHYTAKDGTRRVLDFTKEYLTDLANNKAVDKIGFLLADKDNAHTMDPEKWRGEVAEFSVRDDGLYGKIVFPNAEAAKAVIDNPSLGVSARIRENIARSDGSTVNRGIIHVLGTLDPQVSGMSPWQTTDLSIEGNEFLDLSNEEYEDMAAKKSLKDYTEADIDAMTEEELDKFLAEFVPGLEAYTESETEVEKTEVAKTKIAEPEKVLEGADMSKQVQADIDLANQAVAQANARAEEAMRRVAEAEWKQERDVLLSAGVPPFALDLAAPVLNRADDMVIDLSNHDEDDVNVSEVVRGLLGALKGSVDLSNEQGHAGTFTEGEDPDKALLDAWLAQG